MMMASHWFQFLSVVAMFSSVMSVSVTLTRVTGELVWTMAPPTPVSVDPGAEVPAVMLTMFVQELVTSVRREAPASRVMQPLIMIGATVVFVLSADRESSARRM